MTRIIGIASRKGGVGTTTIALNLGSALLRFGADNIVLDANISNPHLGMHLGSPRNASTVHGFLKGRCSMSEAVHYHAASGLKVIPGDISPLNPFDPKNDHFSHIKRNIPGFSFVIADLPSLAHPSGRASLALPTELLLVTTADLPSVIETAKAAQEADALNIPITGVVVNMLRHESSELSFPNIRALVRKPIVAAIPDDPAVRQSLRIKHPVVHSHPDSAASVAFKRLAAGLLGQEYRDSL